MKKKKVNKDNNFIRLWKGFKKFLPLIGGCGDSIRKEMRYNFDGLSSDLKIEDAVKELERRYKKMYKQRRRGRTQSTGPR